MANKRTKSGINQVQEHPRQAEARCAAHEGKPRRCKKDIDGADEEPLALPVNVEGIPAELRELKRWVGWRWTWSAKKAKWDKPPLKASTGRGASSTDANTSGCPGV
jgi:hypothetical protein